MRAWLRRRRLRKLPAEVLDCMAVAFEETPGYTWTSADVALALRISAARLRK